MNPYVRDFLNLKKIQLFIDENEFYNTSNNDVITHKI